jgi:hypothetical protein
MDSMEYNSGITGIMHSAWPMKFLRRLVKHVDAMVGRSPWRPEIK